jgi:hypothetical protein
LQSSEDLLAAFQVACRYKFAAIPSIVGRRILTSDLASTSASVAGLCGPDYFRARILAFALVLESGRRSPWNTLYAEEVRGYCQVQARRGPVSRRLVAQQFRFGGISAKGVAFFCAAMFGQRGIQMWNTLAALRRKYLLPKPGSDVSNVGQRGWGQSLAKNRELTSSGR